MITIIKETMDTLDTMKIMKNKLFSTCGVVQAGYCNRNVASRSLIRRDWMHAYVLSFSASALLWISLVNAFSENITCTSDNAWSSSSSSSRTIHLQKEFSKHCWRFAQISQMFLVSGCKYKSWTMVEYATSVPHVLRSLVYFLGDQVLDSTWSNVNQTV